MWLFSQIWLYLGKEGVQKVVSESKTKMTAEERENAIKICMNEGLNEEMCTCIINKTADEFTLAEMGKLNQDMKKDGLSLEADMIVRECANEIMPDYELEKN